MRTFQYETVVTAEQIDVFGHLNNAAYLSLFELARWAVLSDIGSAWADVAAGGVGPVVLDVALHFVKEVRGGERLRIETHFEATSPRRFVVFHRMLDQGGQLRASAEIQAGFFDMKARRLTEPAPMLLAALGLDRDALPTHPIVQGLGGAFLYARELDTLAAWYADRLGLGFQHWGDSRGIEFPSADRVPSRRVATTTFALFQADFTMPASRTGRLNFRVGDLDAVVAKLTAAGESVELGPEDYGRFAWTYDPEGNKVELWEPPRLQ